MARKKSWGLKGLFAAFAAVLVALAALPATALAAYTTQTGNITVSNVNPGETVTLYQVVEYTYDETNNTVDWDFTADFDIDRVTYRDAEDDGNTIKGFANTMASYVLNTANNFSSVLIHKAEVGPDASSVTFNNLPDGEYLVIVTPTDGSTRIYDRAIAKLEPTYQGGNWTLGSVNMAMKSIDQPPVDKTVDVNDQAQQGPVSSFKPDDTVNFDIASVIPEYPSNAVNTRFAIGDTMSPGLTFNDNIVVTVVPAEGGESQTLTVNTHYALTPANDLDGKTFEIVFKYDQIKQFAGWHVTVSYSATVNDAAVAGPIENNTATVEFARDPYVANVYDTDDDEVKLYTYTIQIQKVDADDATKNLVATFDVRTDADDPESTVGTITTSGETGLGSISDLPAGKYYLVETAAPGGYQLDATPIEIVISENTDPAATAADLVVSYVNGDADGEHNAITNTKTPSLPVTGGEGTIAITATGVVLIAGAAALIVRARRQHNN